MWDLKLLGLALCLFCTIDLISTEQLTTEPTINMKIISTGTFANNATKVYKVDTEDILGGTILESLIAKFVNSWNELMNEEEELEIEKEKLENKQNGCKKLQSSFQDNILVIELDKFLLGFMSAAVVYMINYYLGIPQ